MIGQTISSTVATASIMLPVTFERDVSLSLNMMLCPDGKPAHNSDRSHRYCYRRSRGGGSIRRPDVSDGQAARLGGSITTVPILPVRLHD